MDLTPIRQPPSTVEAPTCELALSADKKWMRLIIDNKQIATFHVDYVLKTIGLDQNSINSFLSRPQKGKDITQ